MADLAKVKLVLEVEGADKASAEFKAVDAASSRMATELQKSTNKIRDFQGGISNVGKSFKDLEPVVGGAGSKISSELEKSTTKLKETQGGVSSLGTAFKVMGA